MLSFYDIQRRFLRNLCASIDAVLVVLIWTNLIGWHTSDIGAYLWVGLSLAVVQIFVGWRFALYHEPWRLRTLQDLGAVVQTSITSVSLVMLGLVIAKKLKHLHSMPWVIYIIIITLSLLCIRLIANFVLKIYTTQRQLFVGKARVLLVGANEFSTDLLAAMLADRKCYYTPVILVDDCPQTLGQKIHGISVVGNILEIGALCFSHKIEKIIIAIPDISTAQLAHVVQQTSQLRLPILLLDLQRTHTPSNVTLQQLRPVKISDFLGLENVHASINWPQVRSVIQQKTILITGYGRLGEDLYTQILTFRPKAIVIVDQSEAALEALTEFICEKVPGILVHAHLVNLQDEYAINHLFQEYRPDIVLHTAGHHSLDLLEQNPREAMNNNVVVTYHLALAAIEYKTEKFVLFSDSNASYPERSILGLCKYCSEIILTVLQQQASTCFLSVRIGELSVDLDKMWQHIELEFARNNVVVIKDADLPRFFVSKAQAVPLLLQALAFAQGGEVFTIDMGEELTLEMVLQQMLAIYSINATNVGKLKFMTHKRPALTKKFAHRATNLLSATANRRIFKVASSVKAEKLVAADLQKLLSQIEDKSRVLPVRELLQLMHDYLAHVAH
jgi:FlaA1/EpsC-like NDP-sugar epimerase